ncbi:MAG: acyl carrier protein [Cyanobacteria bacterium P01_F01_bin.143]
MTNNNSEKRTAKEIKKWCVSYIAEILEIDPDEIETSVSFDRYGLDSSAAITLTGDLEEWSGLELDPTLMYDYPTIDALAKYLAQSNE